MSEKLTIVSTFIAGLIVGAGLLYLSPPAPQDAPSGVPQMARLPPGNHATDGGPGPQNSPPGDIPADAQYPPPPAGAGPADGAKGPPLPEGGPQPEGPPLPEGQVPADDARDWVSPHLDHAAELLQAIVDEARDTGHESIAADALALIATAPQTRADLPPPIPDVVVFIDGELRLLDRIEQTSMDASALASDLAPIRQARHD